MTIKFQTGDTASSSLDGEPAAKHIYTKNQTLLLVPAKCVVSHHTAKEREGEAGTWYFCAEEASFTHQEISLCQCWKTGARPLDGNGEYKSTSHLYMIFRHRQ